MKKSIFIIVSLAAVVLFSSFVIARNVTNDKTDNPVTVSANDGWEYYKSTTGYYSEGKKHSTIYIWKKTVCGDPDYVLSNSSERCDGYAISKNYYYGKDQDWTTSYKYTARDSFNGTTFYFNCYLQGWD